MTLKPTWYTERIVPGAWLALLALFAVMYVGSMFAPGIQDDADATHASAARAMAQSGDFVTLKVNGVRYLEKPPMVYWLAAIAFKIFGVSEFSLRLPLVLGILACTFLAADWTRRAFGAHAGAYAGLFTLTTFGVYLFTRTFIPEVLLSFFLAGSLYFFLTALEDGTVWRWYAGYAALAFGVLTKGLVALVFVGGAMFFYLLISGEWRRWREFRLVTGSLLFLAIAAPWHILAGLRNTGGADGHGFFWFYFINEHVLRFLGKRFPKDYNRQPIWAYWLGHAIWLFPWSTFLPLAVKEAIQEFRERNFTQDFTTKTRLLCWIYAAIILVFFSLSTNQEYYTFPCYLPLAVLLAGAMVDEEERHEGRKSAWLLGGQWLLTSMGVAASLALFFGLWKSRHLAFLPDIGMVMASRGIGGYTLSMSRIFDLTDAAFAALRLPAVIAACALLVGPVISKIFRQRAQHFYATWAVGLTAAAFLVAANMALVRFEPVLSSKSIAVEFERVAKPGDRLMIYGDQAFGSSLLFYTGRQILLVNGNTTSMYFGSTFPDAPKIFLSDGDLKREWASPQRVFILVTEDHRKPFEDAAGRPVYEIASAGEKLFFSNRQ